MFQQFLKMMDGKKTYAAATVLGALGLAGVDVGSEWTPETVAQLLGVVVATAATYYGRWSATAPKKAKRSYKRRAPKAKAPNA